MNSARHTAFRCGAQPRVMTALPSPTLRARVPRSIIAHSAATEAPSKRDAINKMERMVHSYFQRVLTSEDAKVARTILDPEIEHHDMVRDIGYKGVDQILGYVREVKRAYPKLWVEAVDFGPSEDGRSIFAAFEGLATDTTPLFKGVDHFRFNADISRIVEVEVYRSNWQGAKGHEERKTAAEGKKPSLV